MNEEISIEIPQIIISDPGQALRPLHKQTKLTRKKKIQLLKQLEQEFNISKAAAIVGIHRKAVNYLMNHDPMFKEAVNDVKEAWLDQSEGSGLRVAIQPTREGFNDRKLFLSAHREAYKPKPEIQINQQFNLQEGEVDSTLTRILTDNS